MMSPKCPGNEWFATPASISSLAFVLCSVSIQAAVPFPQALDSAAIVQDRCDDLLDRSCIIGNGDINALVYSDSGNLLLRLSKNDVWDARFDTSQDPPLLPIRKIRELAQGDWLKTGAYGGGYLNPDGSPYNGPNSWDKPYPCPLSCGVIRLGDRPLQPHWRLHRAEGEHNAFVRDGACGVMSIAGRQGASNGFAYGGLEYSTDPDARLRVQVSGTANARYYVDVLGPGNSVVFGSGWIDTPQSPEERVFNLPPKARITTIVLYTWTKDGQRAQNRFHSLRLERPNGNLPLEFPTSAETGNCPTRLDLRRAVLEVEGSKDGCPGAVVRALADRNVFWIESPASASLEPVVNKSIPAAQCGTTNGIRWLLQEFPRDVDWPGMRYAVALAERGPSKVVAVVTSFDSPQPLADALQLVRSTLETRSDSRVKRHEAIWQEFWSASGVNLDDSLLRDAWYRNLYFLRCVSKPGVTAVGLFAGLVDNAAAWHGSYTMNYNAEQTFFSSFNCNHPELAEPYIRLISEYMPRARWLAREVYDCNGACFPHNLYGHDNLDPAQCRSNKRRQHFYHTWSYTLGVTGFSVQNVWWRYKYDPDRAFLESTAYPIVRDVARFYADFMDSCSADPKDTSKIVLAPTVSPEHWGWTYQLQRNRNSAFDIGFFRFIFEAAIEGAKTLRRDSQLVERFDRCLRRMPDYPVSWTAPPIVVDVADAPPIEYNIAVPITPVFPCDVVTWWSPEREKELFARTLAGIKWNGNNSMVMLAVARARLSLPDSYPWIREEIATRLRPNGTLTLNRWKPHHDFNDFGHYTEQFAATMVISEMLLQSVGDIIRLFPAWPRDREARFADLRAQGGFLVSASLSRGSVQPFVVTPTAKAKLRVLSPWPTIAVQRTERGHWQELKLDERGIATMAVAPGQRLRFQESTPIQR